MAEKDEHKPRSGEVGAPKPSGTPEKPRPAAEPIRARTEAELQGDGLDQIREILFGLTQRELERKIARQDAQLTARAQELQIDSRRRTEVVEVGMRREVEELNHRLEQSQSEAGNTIRGVTTESREALSRLEQRLAKLEESIVRTQRELRQQLLEHEKSFLDELQRVRQDFASTLERELSLLGGETTNELHPDEAEERHTH
jgi:hypothetical protein